MDSLLFVYGTLKEGFPNFARNSGTRLPGVYQTRLAYPLYVVRLPNEDRAPWLVDEPGVGSRVCGQVFRVDATLLQAMDVFEEVGLPTGYVRAQIELNLFGGGAGSTLLAHAYLKPASHLGDCLSLEGPYAEYSLELATGYELRVPPPVGGGHVTRVER